MNFLLISGYKILKLELSSKGINYSEFNMVMFHSFEGS
jgi:hypothetical protein